MNREVFANIEFQSKLGEGCRMFQILNGSQVLKLFPCEAVTCEYKYPLKVMIPSSAADSCCQWLYPIIFGGGLVEGDSVAITLKIGERCCILFTSLSFPKVYCCNNNLESQQHLKCDLESKSLLCVLPDPLVCYKHASYVQTQTFYLASDANLVLLDWFTSGRYERGERWSFSKLKSISSIYIDGKLLYREAQNIQSTPLIKIEKAMENYNIIGTCMIIGPGLEALSEHILCQIGKCKSYGEKGTKSQIFSTSPLYLKENSKHGCIIRFATVSVSDAIRRIEELLYPLFAIVGENPFINK